MRKLILALIILIGLIGIVKANIVVPPNPDPAHLVLWYRFDEANNTYYVIDYSGHGNNGTVYGYPQVVPGRYGYGLSFDGVGDYVEISGSYAVSIAQAINESKEFTVSMWIKPYAWVAPNDVGRAHWLFANANDLAIKTGPAPDLVVGYKAIDGKLYWIVYNIDPNLLNHWFMVTFLYNNSTGYMQLYVNGKLVAQRYVGLPPYLVDVLTFTTPYIRLGFASVTGYQAYGAIDELRIYNTSLTADQIREMYEALRVKFYDEETGAKIEGNATIFNGNYSITLPTDNVTKEAVLFYANVTQYGTYQLTVSANGYYPRNYIVKISDTRVEKNTYLLSNTSDAILNTFTLADYTGKFPVGRAILIVKKVIGEGAKDVVEEYFDVNGVTTAYLDINSYYILCVSNGVDTVNLGWFKPTGNTLVKVSVEDLIIKQPLAYFLLPLSTTLTEGNVTFVFNINPRGHYIDEAGLEIYINKSLVASTNVTNINGPTTLSLSVYINNTVSSVKAVGYYIIDGVRYNVTKVFVIPKEIGLWSVFTQLNDEINKTDTPSIIGVLIASFITLTVVCSLAYYTSFPRKGLGLVGLVIFSMISMALGAINISILAMTWMVAIALMVVWR